MKEKILYFVVGEYPTPEETAEILKLAEPVEVSPAVGTEGEDGYVAAKTVTPNVEVMSVQKMPADHVVNLQGVTELAGAVPTNYRDAANGDEGAPKLHREYVKPLMTLEAVSAPLDTTGPNADDGRWVASETAKPETRKRR